MNSSASDEKLGQEQIIAQYAPSFEESGQQLKQNKWQHLKHYFTSREGWIGDYDYVYLITPNIWPLNRKYKDYVAPFYGLNDEIPILLTILLGLQHALTMIGSIVSPPLAIAGGAFNFDPTITQYLVSAAFITTGISTALQVTRVHIAKTPFYIGTGLLSVVGPTFDIIPIAINYTSMRYKNGTCPTADDGTQLPCPDAWGAILGSMLCTVWIQIGMSLVPPKKLNKIFPKTVTGSLLLLVGVYLINSGMQNWGGSSNCNGGSGFYELCPSISAPKPLPWGDPKLIGLGFSVFITVIFVEQFGSPLMKSASVVLGLAMGCIISGATGYWSVTNINAAPAVTFLWVHTFKLSVDGALILPFLIMFICEAVSCMPDILATAEISSVDIEGTQFNSRIQGGILCDGLGSLLSAFGTGLPMVSQAGNNGVISLTGCASRRAGWCASAFLILMGIFGKFGAVFGSMPPSVLGGMQVFLYSTIAVAGIRVLGLIEWNRRNRFVLTASLGVGFMDIVQPAWFSSVLDYQGDNVRLQGFEQGINLIVQTPFIVGAVVGVFLNLVLPREAGGKGDGRGRDGGGGRVIEGRVE
ncbi:purine permease, putative [Glarea lozoyensis ATCC 20868]|uniref:Purine permease, putative n=1 Tax=Glarea lozoyensis (strain ATCC 20868 / MF5171) TaxID=1116229 RepID=S3DDQ2_GLAL2|nr:purine permease, putative [Glarea lozoyensis ATCC 20868]EPE30116.1 purine permease, putative [Glarea lozoyensis ATCC 20868]